MKIAIAHHKKVYVENFAKILTKIHNHRISWIAQDGKETFVKLKENKPDVLLLGLDLPGSTGVEIIRKIMHENPCPILILTYSSNFLAPQIFEALGSGALDVYSMSYPNFADYPQEVNKFLQKLDVIGALIGMSVKNKSVLPVEIIQKKERKKYPNLLLLGASTGGPAALAKLLATFPSYVPFSTIITQHIDEKYAAGLALWLGKQTKVPVRIAVEGDIPEQNVVLIAGKNNHLLVNKKQQLTYSDEFESVLYRPSVDMLFLSAAENWPERESMGVLLTGMGLDGAKGLKALQTKGWFTVAQSQRSCVVYGMPKAAIEMNAAAAILDLEEISKAIWTFYGLEAAHDRVP